MQWPDPAMVWTAIDAYVRVAYGDSPPSAVRARLDALRTQCPDSFYDCTVFQKDPGSPRLLLRLGNRTYPHMKLVIEPRPDGLGCIFRTDTHDAHCCPAAGSREYDAFRALMESNRTIALAIDAEWERLGIPTFKTYLKEDLARRHTAPAPE